MRKSWLIVMALLLVGVRANSANAQVAVDQTLFLTFIPNVQFAPVYVALEKGYFAENGINLTIQHGDEPVGVDLIAANQLQFGIVGGEQVIAARANGRPVVFVYEWFQNYPVGVVAPVEAGIASVEDLRGRRVGLPGFFGASYTGIQAMLAAADMTQGDVQLEPIGFNAPEIVCVGGVDAAVVYINNEPLQIRQRAQLGDCGSVSDVIVLPVADYADLVSNGLITNETMIAENPDLVRAMVAAFDAGLRDAIRNPAEAYLLSARHVEGLLTDDQRVAFEAAAAEQAVWLDANPAPDASTAVSAYRLELATQRMDSLVRLYSDFDPATLLQYAVLVETITFWDADQLGVTDPVSWAVTQDTLLNMALLSAPLDDLDAAFTNVFLPEQS
ncbi:MAG: ABC transporter substrate-binding protein [Chloroflexota bacterium]|nr:ABC transporter substrate-binding protein [Chloroflexota bacterium]